MDRVEIVFRGIQHFAADEFDRPDKVDGDALRLLDRMRHEEGIRCPIIITINADYSVNGHSAKSRHARRRPLSLDLQFAMASRYSWGGIGIYPFWLDPGLHVDRRPWAVFNRRALWFRDEAGKYHSITKYFGEEE